MHCLLQFYDFGTSEVMTKAVFRDRINGMIEKYSSEGPLYLVFHDAPGDIKYVFIYGMARDTIVD